MLCGLVVYNGVDMGLYGNCTPRVEDAVGAEDLDVGLKVIMFPACITRGT